MAVNTNEIINNIENFIKLDNKIILSVGSGGGQLVGYGKNAKKIIAIDNDFSALNKLKNVIQSKELNSNYEYLCDDFMNIKISADIVFFEFSLHEMINPVKAIKHAKTITPTVIILDHNIESNWLYIVCEENKVAISDNAIMNIGVKNKIVYSIEQYFKDYKSIKNKVESQGNEAILRIEKYKNQNDIKIKMKYNLIEV